MRKMFSKTQIKEIGEAIADIKILDALGYDKEDDSYNFDKAIYFGEDVFFSKRLALELSDFSQIKTGSETTLQNALDEKQEVNPTDLSGIANTFGDNPIQHQLPAENKSNLTTEEENQIWNNMLYWIKKGYICDGNIIIKIGMYYIEESTLTICASCAIYNSGAVDEYEQRKARVDKLNHEYTFLTESV